MCSNFPLYWCIRVYICQRTSAYLASVEFGADIQFLSCVLFCPFLKINLDADFKAFFLKWDEGNFLTLDQDIKRLLLKLFLLNWHMYSSMSIVSYFIYSWHRNGLWIKVLIYSTINSEIYNRIIFGIYFFPVISLIGYLKHLILFCLRNDLWI